MVRARPADGVSSVAPRVAAPLAGVGLRPFAALACALLLPATLTAGCGDDSGGGGGSATDSATTSPTTTGEATTDTASTTATTTATTGATETDTETDTDTGSEGLDVYGFAGDCVALRSDAQWLQANGGGDGYTFVTDGMGGAARFTMKASDLGSYLFYDEGRGYLVAEGGPLLRQAALDSDVSLVDDTYVSGAEWILETSTNDPTRYQLRSKKTGDLLGAAGVVSDATAALALTIEPASGCVEHPELTLDAMGAPQTTTWPDGDVWGMVDTHSHILSNFGFGGGGIFHGAAFHPLGVEHALSDCEQFHGENGRKDFFGFAFDGAGPDDADIASLIPEILAGELNEDNHITDGYPEFTQWPAAPTSSTHQAQYYRWLERAHLAGLRLVVQHATTNSVICNFVVGQGVTPVRYSCDDMVAVDRIIEETYAMERYIDAQAGGPGLGFFRIVFTPAEARDVIRSGKMAVILGIETSDLFDCSLTPRPGKPPCDEDYVQQSLDRYWDLGVRAIFPVHKYDNKFVGGDGDRAFIELGNFLNSGHWSNFGTGDCPQVNTVFDRGDVAFGGLNMPRDVYDSPAPNDFTQYALRPIGTLFPFLGALSSAPLVGDYCQNAGIQPLGEFLVDQMMRRGMILEVDHLNRRAYTRMFEILEANDYPPAATHGSNYDGRVYALGGISKTGIGTCRSAAEPGSTMRRFTERAALILANGGYPAEGFGFDLNGFAGAPGPRFADGACAEPQTDPVTYPFTSLDGGVTFTQPQVGNRTIDFNQEGLAHIGLLPELVDDARRDAGDAAMEPLFRSAEGYLRMWEKAEARGAALSGR